MTTTSAARIASVSIALALALTGCGSRTDQVAPASAVQVTSSTPTTVAVPEDDPRFNCLTMGNRVCGPVYVPFPEAVVDAQGVAHTGCLIAVQEPESTVVCPDGFMELS